MVRDRYAGRQQSAACQGMSAVMFDLGTVRPETRRPAELEAPAS